MPTTETTHQPWCSDHVPTDEDNGGGWCCRVFRTGTHEVVLDDDPHWGPMVAIHGDKNGDLTDIVLDEVRALRDVLTSIIDAVGAQQ